MPTTYKIPQAILDALCAERQRQCILRQEGKLTFDCASADVNPDKKLRVLVEEVGEVAKAINNLADPKTRAESSDHLFALLKQGRQELRAELTQVAAVAIAWIESVAAEDR